VKEHYFTEFKLNYLGIDKYRYFEYGSNIQMIHSDLINQVKQIRYMFEGFEDCFACADYFDFFDDMSLDKKNI
jgi:hypothetical protein